jgi:hypothetical protein
MLLQTKQAWKFISKPVPIRLLAKCHGLGFLDMAVATKPNPTANFALAHLDRQ